MYNIKQAAARAGVSVPVLRAWERRYGIVAPERSASGYRRFDDAGVARVRTMRALVDQGWSPSAAAAAIIDGRVAVADQRPAPETAVTPERGAANAARAAARSTGAGSAPELGEALVDAAARMDSEAVDRVLDDLFARGSFERVADDLLFPALHRLGDAWASGEVSVAGEHLASNAVTRRLGQALEAAGSRASGAGRIVVGLPPGGRHELGALAFAVAARRAGLPVTYLGPDLPVADWVAAVEGAAAAVIGVVTARDRTAAIKVADGLNAASPKTLVAFGGRAAPEAAQVVHLGGSLNASVAALQGALEARAH